MTAPSNANTSGLEVVAWEIKFPILTQVTPQQDLAYLAKKRGHPVEPLVNAASAQARIAELNKEVERWISAYSAAHDQATENGGCATAAEARADRLAKGIVQAETLIDDAIKGIQTAPLSVVTDTIWTADPCPMTVVEALQLARAALQQETQK